jgi:uncharacterized sulfatase
VDAPGGGGGWDGSLNDPMNGEKGTLIEGGIRTPFVVYWKGTIPSGQVYEHPVIALDVAATANSLAGLPDDPDLDGENLVPDLTGQKSGPPHESLYWAWGNQFAIRKGKWKYLTGGGRNYLFDLDADVSETTNLLSQYPDKAAAMRSELEAWSQTLLRELFAEGTQPTPNETTYRLTHLESLTPAEQALHRRLLRKIGED